jgi:hypothetical protein
MIKKFKMFEAVAVKFAPNFNIGDKVVCIDDDGMEHVIKKGELYTINNIIYTNYGYYFCDLIEKFDISVQGRFACTRFISEIEMNANKYNI